MGNVKEFRDRFHQYVAEHIAPEQTEAMLNIDAMIDFKDITKQLHSDLKKFSPLVHAIANPYSARRTYMITAPARWWAESKSISNWNW